MTSIVYRLITHYGRSKGDQVIITVALLLQKMAEEHQSYFARFSRDKFVLVFKGGNASKVLQIAERIHQASHELDIEHLVSTVSQKITMSFALSSMFPSDLNNKEMLIAEAQLGLKEAKLSGKDQVDMV